MNYREAMAYLKWHYVEKPDYVEPRTEDALAVVGKTVARLLEALEASILVMDEYQQLATTIMQHGDGLFGYETGDWLATIEALEADIEQARAALADARGGED